MIQEKFSPSVLARDAAAWRAWLMKYHASRENVWLIIYHKNSGHPSITYSEAVDEALCFGWIDSVPKKRDPESYYQFFARRNPKSNWSRINKDKVGKLFSLGKMHPAGMKIVSEAKKRSTWDALNEVDALVEPADLVAAFSREKEAYAFWKEFPPSSKRSILEWINAAKRPETRQKRITETVEKAAQDIRANHWHKPKRH